MRVPALVAACVLSLLVSALLLGCGASNTPLGSFSLAATPASVSLQPGASAAVTVVANGTNGFAGTVSATFTGLPAGVTAAPATVSLTPGTPQTVTLTASASAAVSTATATLTGTSGSLTETTPLSVAVTPLPADFSLSVTPATENLLAGGGGATVSVLATPVNGFTGTVAVALTGLPAGVTASPATLTLTPGAAQGITLTAVAGTPAETAALTLAATAGTLTHTASVALTVTPPPPSFTLAVSPAAQTLVAGAAGTTVSVLATPVNGFNGPVTVSLAGLPAGVSASPATLSLTPGSPASVTLTATTAAAVGAATVSFNGVSGTLSASASLALTVAPAPDFSLAVTPSALSLAPGGTSATVSVQAAALNGFTGPVTVVLSGLPVGVTASPSTLTLTPGTAATVSLTAASTATAGSGNLTFTATAAALTHTASLALTVSAAPDFSLAVTPATQTLTAGGTSATVSVLATPANGFTGPVAVALSGLPAGVTASPATLTLTPGAAQTVTLTAASTASAGNATLTLTGTSGSLSHTASLALSVAAAAGDFTLSVTPGTQSLTDGGSPVTLSVLATATNGFTAPVNVTLAGLPTGVTASPASLTLTPGAAQTVTLTSTTGTTAAGATLTFTGTSGTLSHTATAALTFVAAPADFSLAVTPGTQSITVGGAPATISVLATAINSFSSTVNVALTGLPAGVTANPATLSLSAGTAQTLTLTATGSALAGTATVTFTGTSGTLSHTATLALTVAPPVGPDVTTYHYDNTRDGLNAQETILTPANVTSATFGLLAQYPVDGKVDAQPLYVGGLPFGGANPHTANVLYIATEHDSVYALDAATGHQEWKTSILGAGETTSDPHNCNQISPEIGITSTPVIDRTHGPNGAIFVIGMTKDASGNYHQRLHALDLTTGAELPGSPTEITATYPGAGENSSNGQVVFAPGQYAERVGLLLLNSTVYTAWTSHCDIQPYTGWVMGFSENTLAQTSVLNLTPNGEEGSVWMSGYGLGADTAGNIYLLDANGTLDNSFNASSFPSDADFGNAMVKLSTANGTLAVSDYFEPYNSISESANDVDLGSGGAMLLPDLTDNAGVVHHLLVGAGKDGNIYVANRDYMGKFNPANNMQIYQQITGALPSGAWSGPAYFNNTVYYGGNGDVLRAFTIADALLSTAPTSTSSTNFAYPGTTPSVSSNGTQNGIVWALESATGSAAVLHAYDATNLGHELYNSTEAPNGRDAFGLGNKFITPMVTNGMVFVGTPTGVAVFGLLP